MNKRKRIFLVLLTVAAAGALFWWRFCESAEPSYQGKPLRDWLETYVQGGSYIGVWANPETDEAIRRMGTNAIPALLKMISARDSKWKSTLSWYSTESMRRRISRRFSWWSAGFATDEAAQAIVALGPSASNAVPQLIQTYRKNIGSDSQASCLKALGSIGPAAALAIPDFLGATTNWYPRTRRAAVKALGNLHVDPGLAVPVLIACLQDSDTGTRRYSVEALAKFGAEAKAAVPALTKLAGDPSFTSDVNNALSAIDADEAAKASIK